MLKPPILCKHLLLETIFHALKRSHYLLKFNPISTTGLSKGASKYCWSLIRGAKKLDYTCGIITTSIAAREGYSPANIFPLHSIGLSRSAARGGTVEGGLITPSEASASLTWKRGGLAQRRPASTSHPVALGWKLTLYLSRRLCGGIRLAIGGQNQ